MTNETTVTAENGDTYRIVVRGRFVNYYHMVDETPVVTIRPPQEIVEAAREFVQELKGT